MKVKLLTATARVPERKTQGAAGFDLHADLVRRDPKDMFARSNSIHTDTDGVYMDILPGGRVLVPTGVSVAIDEGFEGQVRPRSGLSLKKGLTVLNSPGTIDSDYRGEVGVILYNASNEIQIIRHGERVAQLVLSPVPTLDIELVSGLDETERGEGGFGSTGQ